MRLNIGNFYFPTIKIIEVQPNFNGFSAENLAIIDISNIIKH